MFSLFFCLDRRTKQTPEGSPSGRVAERATIFRSFSVSFSLLLFGCGRSRRRSGSGAARLVKHPWENPFCTMNLPSCLFPAFSIQTHSRVLLRPPGRDVRCWLDAAGKELSPDHIRWSWCPSPSWQLLFFLLNQRKRVTKLGKAQPRRGWRLSAKGTQQHSIVPGRTLSLGVE